MNPFGLIADFLFRASTDPSCGPFHISLYLSLILARSRQGNQDPFSISRSEMMEGSKIQSYATYHKCMRELVASGYIRYVPSYHPVIASLIWVLPLV